MEAEEAKDAQVILGDAGEGIADEAHAARFEIVEAAEIVEYLAARRIRGQRVDREVAPGGVLLPVPGIGDGGAAAVGRDVAAQRRDLDGATGKDGGDGAMGKAGRDRPDGARLQPAHHLLGREPGGEIDVADVHRQQRVADAAADETGLPRSGAEKVEQPIEAGPMAPGGIGKDHAKTSRRLRLTIIAAVAPQIRCPSQSIS